MKLIDNLFKTLLSAYLLRLLITGASVGDAIVLLSLSALNALLMHLDSKKEPEANKDLKDRLASLEERFQKQEHKVNAMTLGNSLRR